MASPDHTAEAPHAPRPPSIVGGEWASPRHDHANTMLTTLIQALPSPRPLPPLPSASSLSVSAPLKPTVSLPATPVTTIHYQNQNRSPVNERNHPLINDTDSAPPPLASPSHPSGGAVRILIPSHTEMPFASIGEDSLIAYHFAQLHSELRSEIIQGELLQIYFVIPYKHREQFPFLSFTDPRTDGDGSSGRRASIVSARRCRDCSISVKFFVAKGKNDSNETFNDRSPSPHTSQSQPLSLLSSILASPPSSLSLSSLLTAMTLEHSPLSQPQPQPQSQSSPTSSVTWAKLTEKFQRKSNSSQQQSSPTVAPVVSATAANNDNGSSAPTESRSSPPPSLSPVTSPPPPPVPSPLLSPVDASPASNGSVPSMSPPIPRRSRSANLHSPPHVPAHVQVSCRSALYCSDHELSYPSCQYEYDSNTTSLELVMDNGDVVIAIESVVPLSHPPPHSDTRTVWLECELNYQSKLSESLTLQPSLFHGQYDGTQSSQLLRSFITSNRQLKTPVVNPIAGVLVQSVDPLTLQSTMTVTASDRDRNSAINGSQICSIAVNNRNLPLIVQSIEFQFEQTTFNVPLASQTSNRASKNDAVTSFPVPLHQCAQFLSMDASLLPCSLDATGSIELPYQLHYQHADVSTVVQLFQHQLVVAVKCNPALRAVLETHSAEWIASRGYFATPAQLLWTCDRLSSGINKRFYIQWQLPPNHCLLSLPLLDGLAESCALRLSEALTLTNRNYLSMPLINIAFPQQVQQFSKCWIYLEVQNRCTLPTNFIVKHQSSDSTNGGSGHIECLDPSVSTGCIGPSESRVVPLEYLALCCGTTLREQFTVTLVNDQVGLTKEFQLAAKVAVAVVERIHEGNAESRQQYQTVLLQ